MVLFIGVLGGFRALMNKKGLSQRKWFISNAISYLTPVCHWGPFTSINICQVSRTQRVPVRAVSITLVGSVGPQKPKQGPQPPRENLTVSKGVQRTPAFSRCTLQSAGGTTADGNTFQKHYNFPGSISRFQVPPEQSSFQGIEVVKCHEVCARSVNCLFPEKRLYCALWAANGRGRISIFN